MSELRRAVGNALVDASRVEDFEDRGEWADYFLARLAAYGFAVAASQADSLREALQSIELYAYERIRNGDRDPGWQSVRWLARAASQDDSLRDHECVCEGEFPRHCGPECECWHHAAASQGATRQGADR